MTASTATFYIWKKKDGHLGVTELPRLRQLEDDNNRLTRLVAELTVDKHMLSEAPRKQVWGPHGAASWLTGSRIPLMSAACGPVDWRSSAARRGIDGVRRAISPRCGCAFAKARTAPPRFGYLRIWVMLRREGWPINRKRVRRLYRLDGLSVRMRVRSATFSRDLWAPLEQ